MRRIALVALASVTIAVTGCASSTKTPTSAAGNHIVINDGNGRPVLTIDVNGTTVELTSSLESVVQHISGRPSKEGARRYAVGGTDVLEARGESDGLKIKGPQGDTRWRAKRKSGKTEIRRGEETEVYTLRPRGSDRVDVQEGDTDIGNVERSASGTVKVKTEDGAVVASTDGAMSGGYGGLLMTLVPPTARAVLVAELVLRGS